MEMNKGLCGCPNRNCSGSGSVSGRRWKGPPNLDGWIPPTGYISPSGSEIPPVPREAGYGEVEPYVSNDELIRYAQAAIDEKIESQKRYTVVDIIRSETYVCAGFTVFIDFLAKQDDADAVTFRAEIWTKISGEIEVVSIRPITEEEAASDRIFVRGGPYVPLP